MFVARLMQVLTIGISLRILQPIRLCEYCIRLSSGMGPCTGPAPIFSLMYNPSPNRIAFDVARHCPEMACRVQRRGVVSVLPESSATTMPAVEVLRISESQTMNRLGHALRC